MISTSQRPKRDIGIDDAGTVTNPLFDYGVGIDTHKNFIQVCVLVKVEKGYKRYEQEFQTNWEDLQNAVVWTLSKVAVVEPDICQEELRYVIESTGTYHSPVVLCFGGKPSIINPLLAGATRRKSDVLDARMLAQHSVSGVWRESFVLPRDGEVLRNLLAERNECRRQSTRIGNRINNVALRYGHTIGRSAPSRSDLGRTLYEDLASGSVPEHPDVCPFGLPPEIGQWITDQYKRVDAFNELEREYKSLAWKYLGSLELPVAEGFRNGHEIAAALESVPGIGRLTALTWIAIIYDPNRFPHEKALAAYVGSDPSLKVSAGKVTSHTKRKGQKSIHHALKMAAVREMSRNDSKLGAWGRLIRKRQKNAGFGRAVNAVARRLAIIMWHVHRKCERFDMSKYHFYIAPKVHDVPIAEMQLPARSERILRDLGFSSAQEIANAFMSTLPQTKGVGPACLNHVKEWIDKNQIKERSPASSSEAQSSNAAENGSGKSKKTDGARSRTSASMKTDSNGKSGNGATKKQRSSHMGNQSKRRSASSASSRNAGKRCTP